MTKAAVLETSLQRTHEWQHEIGEELGLPRCCSACRQRNRPLGIMAAAGDASFSTAASAWHSCGRSGFGQGASGREDLLQLPFLPLPEQGQRGGEICGIAG